MWQQPKWAMPSVCTVWVVCELSCSLHACCHKLMYLQIMWIPMGVQQMLTLGTQTVSTEKYWWQLLMVLVLFCPSSHYYQKTMSHSSINFSFHNGLHLSMLKDLKDAIRYPDFVCIRLNIKFNTNNFSTYIFLLRHFCCMA